MCSNAEPKKLIKLHSASEMGIYKLSENALAGFGGWLLLNLKNLVKFSEFSLKRSPVPAWKNFIPDIYLKK
ncbi:MAG: hypothetical protein ACTS3T_02130 [Almyronema sp.]